MFPCIEHASIYKLLSFIAAVSFLVLHVVPHLSFDLARKLLHTRASIKLHLTHLTRCDETIEDHDVLCVHICRLL